MRITSPLTKTVGTNTYAYTYDPAHPHAVKTVSYTGTSPLDMGPRTISYNAEQMPIRIEQVKAGNTTIVDYLYDGTSTRIKKMVQGGATTFYIGEHCEVINGVLTNYIFAGNLRIAKKTQQGRYYFHKDHLGSSTAMTDANGVKVETTEYVPYGEMREHQGTEVTNYKFTDQELDPEIGLYNYGARLYDPVIGRFITPDTIIPNVYDPQTLNRYSYCRNNPLIYVDPTGHYADPGNDDGASSDPASSDPNGDGNDHDSSPAGMPGCQEGDSPTPNKGLTCDPKETEPTKKEKEKDLETDAHITLPEVVVTATRLDPDEPEPRKGDRDSGQKSAGTPSPKQSVNVLKLVWGGWQMFSGLNHMAAAFSVPIGMATTGIGVPAAVAFGLTASPAFGILGYVECESGLKDVKDALGIGR